ncbi:MAG: hypothetical protein ACI8UO_004189 [Verrucomicrobiales bacterium]|jgi:hypothetical protein
MHLLRRIFRSPAWLVGSLALAIFASRLHAEEIIHRVAPGPWGQIEFYETILEVPDRSIKPPFLTTHTEWIFEGRDRAGAEALMKTSELTTELLALIKPDQLWSVTEQGAKLIPPDALILGLTDQMRLSLYGELENRPKGQFMFHTFGIERGDFRAMASDLPAEIVELVQRLSYPLGDLRQITDTPFLLSQIDDLQLQRKVVRALCRTRSIIPRLRIGPEADIESLARYWSGPNPDSDLRPLLQSVRDEPGAEFIDVIHLLPPLPRKYIASYTNYRDTFYTENPDCFWAALNFFEPQPNQRIHDNLPVLFYVTPDKFESIPDKPPFAFGDTFILQNQTEGFIHAYVHIADDLVFTKNGNSLLYPWLIMRREDMLARYSLHQNVEVHVFRRRRAAATTSTTFEP